MSLRKDVDQCLEWIDSSLGLGVVGSQKGLVGFFPSKALVSLLGPLLAIRSNLGPKGKALMGSRVIWAKYSFKPKSKLTHKWKRTFRVGPSGLGLAVMKGSGANQPEFHFGSRNDYGAAQPRAWVRVGCGSA